MHIVYPTIIYKKIYQYLMNLMGHNFEVIQRALQTLHATHRAAPSKMQECQEAAARLRELRQGVTLGGLNF